MNACIIISALTSLSIIASVLIKPSVAIGRYHLSLYWVIALIGAILILSFKLLPLDRLIEGLTQQSAVNPIKILILFLSMTTLSIFLDEVGFFRYVANWALKRAEGSQRSLFLRLYLVVSLLTVFTSNDIIILTFTPFICYFAKHAKISPVPYLVAEFIAANTWSMALIIGNPTNIYLATAAGIDFLSYAEVMLIPTLLCGVTALAMLLLLFNKQLSEKIAPESEEVHITDKGLLVIGVVHLGGCTLLLTVSSFIGLQMWLVTLCFALSLLICTALYKLSVRRHFGELGQLAARIPWEPIPFVLSMFVLVLALDGYGVTANIATLLGDGDGTILRYGVSSVIFANLINNIPMSVLFSSVLGASACGTQGIYAAIVGSNIGAFVTPIGALAGIMWTGMLKTHQVKFSFLKFVFYGVIIALPSLAAALGGLYLEFYLF